MQLAAYARSDPGRGTPPPCHAVNCAAVVWQAVWHRGTDGPFYGWMIPYRTGGAGAGAGLLSLAAAVLWEQLQPQTLSRHRSWYWAQTFVANIWHRSRLTRFLVDVGRSRSTFSLYFVSGGFVLVLCPIGRDVSTPLDHPRYTWLFKLPVRLCNCKYIHATQRYIAIQKLNRT